MNEWKTSNILWLSLVQNIQLLNTVKNKINFSLYKLNYNKLFKGWTHTIVHSSMGI